MAGAGEMAIPGNVMDFTRTAGGRKLMLILGAAAVVAIMAAVWMWGRQPDYRVLFANFSDRDGGAIVAELDKMNIPYKYADGGGALLVPADRVHDARLKLAAQGLPKGGNVGFELMENQKLGASQFIEQVNFQRAMEGELARSIESLSAVQAARVHLAMPKDSVFVSEQKQPTASVLLNLHPGRVLDAQQVSAIVHLVASSVPELSPKNVTVVDENGNLLSDTSKTAAANGMDPSQIKYVQDYQDNVAKRIESIIAPIVGADNVRAEATADMDFSHSEQAVESYKPNQTPDAMAIRSQQTSESTNGAGGPAGVPGALTNQPPAPATAPITAPAQKAPAAAAAAAPAAVTTTQKDSTVNYEVDKTIQYVQKAGGGLKRLSVAVVVNYRKSVDKSGKVTMKPLTAAELAQVTNLVKEAMGYNQERGDTLNVVNSPFATATPEAIPETPLWKRPETLDLTLQGGKYLLMAVALALLYLRLLKPLLKKIAEAPARPAHSVDLQLQQADVMALPGQRNYQENLSRAQKLASEDPRAVANIVKTWVGSNE
ncbi:flagellar basal-body MS-ring/collar protein FliF [Thiobacillus sedimenti]|uniref:Flagellar M-ring protein n=1 Tax=Thiobacillus sedimenti TaxID=3110231 RepID=A0ABZ1CMS5_9PROT|nr:flagellar basal-body MS-ring/collar protein FliF [Thiobacillus sp. SCUT-2]WRS40708.1 flagellar basal-body MS-ring/collar protein FliF [Thiobacillus sp. SCUT-2]